MKRLLWGATMGAALLAAAMGGATTHHSITVDGDLADFAADEKTAGDPTGDSVYGANNDLGGLYVTWDAQGLYLGFDYTAWGTGVIYLVDTGKSGGVSSLCPASGYSGAFPANVQGSGFNLMVALFAPESATSPSAFVYTLSGTGSTDITASTGVEVQLQETVNTTTPEHKGAVEVRVPWDTLYGLGAGQVPAGAKLRIAGVIRGKQDGDGLGDVSPNQAGAVSQGACGSGSGNTLAVYHEVTVDPDSDGTPQAGWSPGSNSAGADAGPPPDSSPPAPDSAPPPPDSLAPTPDAAPPADSTPPLADGPRPGPEGGVTGDMGGGDGPMAGDGPVLLDAGEDGDRQEEGCACSAKGSSASAGPLALALLGLVLVGRPRRRGRRG